VVGCYKCYDETSSLIKWGGIYLTPNLKEKLLDIKSAFCYSLQYLFTFFASIIIGDRRAEMPLNLHAVNYIMSYFIHKMKVTKVLYRPPILNLTKRGQMYGCESERRISFECY